MAKSPLKYDQFKYTPRGMQTLTEKEIRAEYSRLRSIARKRLERIGETEYRESKMYKYYMGKFKPIKDMTITQIQSRLSLLKSFFSADISLSKMKADSTRLEKIFNRKSNISEENRKWEFLRYLESKYIESEFDSEQAVEFIEENADNQYTPQEFQQAYDRWVREREIERNANRLYRRG